MEKFINKEDIIKKNSSRLSQFQIKVRKKSFSRFNAIITLLIALSFCIGLGIYIQKQKSIECYISYNNGNIESCSLSEQQIENIRNILN